MFNPDDVRRGLLMLNGRPPRTQRRVDNISIVGLAPARHVSMKPSGARRLTCAPAEPRQSSAACGAMT